MKSTNNTSTKKSSHPLPHGLPRTPSHPHLSTSSSWTTFKSTPSPILTSKTTPSLNLSGTNNPKPQKEPSTPTSKPGPMPTPVKVLERKMSVIESTPRGRFAQSYGSVERISVGRSTSFCVKPTFRRQVRRSLAQGRSSKNLPLCAFGRSLLNI